MGSRCSAHHWHITAAVPDEHPLFLAALELDIVAAAQCREGWLRPCRTRLVAGRGLDFAELLVLFSRGNLPC